MLLIATSLILSGCEREKLPQTYEYKPIDSLGFELKFEINRSIQVYQNKNTGNCYTWNSQYRGGELSLVSCEDFGIKTKEANQTFSKRVSI